MPKITWLNLNKSIVVPVGTTILDAAIEHDVPLEHSCGGCCACTTCRIIVHEGAQNISKEEEDEVDLRASIREFSPEITAKLRLGCQSKVMNDIVIEIPE